MKQAAWAGGHGSPARIQIETISSESTKQDVAMPGWECVFLKFKFYNGAMPLVNLVNLILSSMADSQTCWHKWNCFRVCSSCLRLKEKRLLHNNHRDTLQKSACPLNKLALTCGFKRGWTERLKLLNKNQVNFLVKFMFSLKSQFPPFIKTSARPAETRRFNLCK